MREIRGLDLYVESHSELPTYVGELANEFGVGRTSVPAPGWQLRWSGGGLGLENRQLKLQPIRVDWLAPWRGKPLGKKDLFARAVGAGSGRLTSAVDATGGWGRDAARLLQLGFQLTVIEAHPIMFMLLLEAAERAKVENQLWRERQWPRLRLIRGDACTVVPALPEEERQLIYLDPMYPATDRKAKAGAEIQMLQELLFSRSNSYQAELSHSNPLISAEDLHRGLSPHCGRRLVMKRPHWAKPIVSPDLQFSGKAVRYDVWLRT